MGMLHGNKIAWRSDEMWWCISIPPYFILPTFNNSIQYNQPLQLGPPSPLLPFTSLPIQLHTFTLPVHADDILILASDGLSNNLWMRTFSMKSSNSVLTLKKQAQWWISLISWDGKLWLVCFWMPYACAGIGQGGMGTGPE